MRNRMVYPLLKAATYADQARANAIYDERHGPGLARRRRRQRTDQEEAGGRPTWTGIEELDELPDPDYDQVGRTIVVRGLSDAPDRVLTARVLPDDTVDWMEETGSYKVQTSPVFEDDFWNFALWSATGTGSTTTQLSSAAHPGVVRIRSGGTSGDNRRLYLGTAANDLLLQTEHSFEAMFVVAPGSVITNVKLYAGFSSDWSANPPSNFDGLRYDTVSDGTTWRFVQNAAGAVNSGVTVVASTFVQFRLRWVYNPATAGFAVYFSVNDGDETANPAPGLFTGATATQPGFRVHTSNGVAKDLDIDYVAIRSVGIDR